MLENNLFHTFYYKKMSFRINLQIFRSTTDFLLFTEPLTIQLENVTEDLQLELIVLQCNFNLKSQLETTEVPEILKYIGNRNIVITFYLCLIALISPNNKINFPHE